MLQNNENESKLDELEKWFQSNDKLPQKIDRLLLRRFYQCMYGDLEETKKLIEINYALRNRHAHIFLKRDPADEDSRKTFDYADILPLPGLTAEKYKVSLYRFRDCDPLKMHHTEDTRAFFMVSDCRFTTLDDNAQPETMSEGEVQIFDMNGCTMRHISRLTISTLRVYVKFLQLAFPVRLKAIHMINCPTYLDRIIRIVKPFISDEVFKLIRFHTTSIDTLYEAVPREMLPAEYGGNAGTLHELRIQVLQILAEKREYLMDRQQWCIEKTEKRTSQSWRIF